MWLLEADAAPGKLPVPGRVRCGRPSGGGCSWGGHRGARPLSLRAELHKGAAGEETGGETGRKYPESRLYNWPRRLSVSTAQLGTVRAAPSQSETLHFPLAGPSSWPRPSASPPTLTSLSSGRCPGLSPWITQELSDPELWHLQGDYLDTG